MGTHGTACGRYERLHHRLPGSRRAGKGDRAGPGGAAAPWACLCPLRGPHRGLPRILPAAPDPRPQPHPPAGEGAGRGHARKGCADVGLGTCSLAWQWWLPRRRDRQCVGPDGSRVLTILPPPDARSLPATKEPPEKEALGVRAGRCASHPSFLHFPRACHTSGSGPGARGQTRRPEPHGVTSPNSRGRRMHRGH